MAEKGEKTTSSAGRAHAEAATTVAAEAPHAAVISDGPVVLVKKGKKKKKKRKYSRGLKTFGQLQRGAARSSWRLGDAVAAGLKSFRKRNDDSSRKRRDGALRNLFKNASRASGKVLEKSGKVPYDLVRNVSTKAMWRQTRPVMQFLAWPFAR
jgi:hypothetical protein